MFIRIVMLTMVCLTVASCTSNRGPQANTAAELRGRLVQAGLECTGFREIAKQVYVDDEAECTVSGERVTLATFSRPGALPNWEDMSKITGCALAETGSAEKYVWVRGENWTIRPLTRDVAQRIADKVGGDVRSPDC
jgi:hypothetical protein